MEVICYKKHPYLIVKGKNQNQYGCTSGFKVCTVFRKKIQSFYLFCTPLVES
jgi:hypothetical protein